ncbi:MAG: helix-turn-helix domain-containing protein [Roseburia sp.]
MKIENKLLYREFLNRENHVVRAPYQIELDFYTSVKMGELEKVKKLCPDDLSTKEGLGILSDDPLQSLKYHVVIGISMITRYCIDGGMDYHAAYTLSDYYIQIADKCTSINELSSLHKTMCLDYAAKMKDLRSTLHPYSKHVSTCIDYIYDNLHTRITLESLAAHVGLSTAHLSRLFKQETSMSVSKYIQCQKIAVAKRMLEHSDYSISSIAETLAFSSQSHFSNVFFKYTKETPLQYRNIHTREFKF